MGAEELRQRLKSASESESSTSTYRDIVLGGYPNDADTLKIKDEALQKLSDAYIKSGDATALRQLLTDLRPLFGSLPKAKTAKIVRSIIEATAKIPGSTDLQVLSVCMLDQAARLPSAELFLGPQLEMCKEQVEWAKAEKRTFLRQRIEARLANLYLETKDYPAALALIGRLLTEVHFTSLRAQPTIPISCGTLDIKMTSFMPLILGF